SATVAASRRRWSPTWSRGCSWPTASRAPTRCGSARRCGRRSPPASTCRRRERPGGHDGGPMSPPASRSLPVRTVAFAYPDDLRLAWNRTYPEMACAANAISLLMPHIEPYFARSVRAVVDQLDGSLRARTEDYLRQELSHQRQHRRFNDLLV